MAPSPYQPFRPEPEDELILPDAEPGAAATAPIDHTAPGFDDQPSPPPRVEPTLPPPPAPPVAASVEQPPLPPELAPLASVPPPVPASDDFTPPAMRTPPPLPPASAIASPQIPPPEPSPPRWGALPEPYDAAEPYDYRYGPPGDDWSRRGPGMSPLAVGGFVLLGVLAIAVGAFISGIFSGGAATASASPTPLLSTAPTTTSAPSLAPTPVVSVPATPGASGIAPTPLPDGFTARTEPCAEEPSSQDGCGSSGATVSGGAVWAWIGFRKGNSADVIGVNVVDAAGASVGDGSLALGSIGCGDSCSGWARFKFGGLSPGNYTIRVNRNGVPVAEAAFTVTT